MIRPKEVSAMTRLNQNQEIRIRLVHNGAEQFFSAQELGIGNPLDNQQVLSALARRLDTQLDDYTISRFESNVLVAPAPVFG
jgi:hypothetical protein